MSYNLQCDNGHIRLYENLSVGSGVKGTLRQHGDHIYRIK
jgi:hypothetical protein